MGTRRCMNGGCGAAAPGGGGEWRKGWGLRSGGFATLCDKCGMAYEQSVFCDLFHQKESGWRECISCGKRLHCGCIASKSSMDLLDSGGVQCNSCIKNSEMSFVPSQAIQDLLPQPLHSAPALSARSPKDEKANDDFVASLGVRTCELRPTSVEHKMDDDTVSKGNMFQLGKNIEISGQNSLFPTGAFGYIKREQMMLHTGEFGTANFSNRDQGRNISSQISPQNGSRDERTDNMTCGSPTQTCLSISLGNPSRGNMMESGPVAGSQHVSLPLPSAAEEGRDQTKTFSAFQQVQRSRNLLPKPPKAAQGPASEVSKEVFSNMRVARPPGEGRGRNQLLPRYWPRITEQELQQISGDSNSTIVPLFEKVLSASDAGRIGRLVLPKACAEAYFPPISQPEGLPLKIQDSKGKDWHFQFRFWPNNNSRMYVLEGVTPCIQSLQLQAGDTVTFSRIDPEGKLVMGFRKATNSVPLQDSQITAIANAALGNDTFFSGIHENLPIVSGYSGLLQSLKGTADPHLSCLSEQLNSADMDISWLKTDMHGGRPSEGLLMQNYLVQDKKRSRNIGSKSKRLHMDNEDALELMLSWEEAQDLLRPPPSVKPSIVMIEDHEFEEYEDPPVFGKRMIFTARTSGGLDQWMQCDDCFKWRRLPMDVLVPAKWTCAENIWDQKRSSCSAPDELSPRDVHSLLQQNADILKRRRTCANSTQNLSDFEVAGLDALASAAALGEATASPSMPTTAATTTKHPRHRPGCTCIVCIQPPSGKGPKHNPSCTCNVCMTVKRRFKTLMMRKKKRQSEREEAEASKRLAWGNNKEDIEGSSSSARSLQLPDGQKEAELVPEYDRAILDNLEEGKGHILDLNCQPDRDAEQQAGSSSARMSMLSLLEVANRPLENYLKKNGLTSLTSEQQVSSSSVTVPQATGESEGRTPDESYFSPAVREQEVGVDEGCCSGDKDKSDVV